MRAEESVWRYSLCVARQYGAGAESVHMCVVRGIDQLTTHDQILFCEQHLEEC